MACSQGRACALRVGAQRGMRATAAPAVRTISAPQLQGRRAQSTAAAAALATTPEKKQSFDWIYNEPDPMAYTEHILEKREYVCDNFTRQEFDRLLLAPLRNLVASSPSGKVNVAEIGMCFGNTTLALVNGLKTEEVKHFWRSSVSCEPIEAPRRFPCHVTGVDLSSSAMAYCKRVGIADETIAADLNSEAGLEQVVPVVNQASLLISTASLVYLDVPSVERVVAEFAAGSGEGYMIVNFLNPFELEKSDTMKSILLKHLDFVGSTATRHRTLSELESNNYPEFGDWALLEIWTLKRRVQPKQAPALTAEEDLRAQAYYDSDDAFQFYKEVWGGEHLHVGIYDDAALSAMPMGPQRIALASEHALERLLQKAPPSQGSRVMDMGSAYGGCARYVAGKFGANVSCVDLSAKENARNRELTAAAGLEHLVHCPSERSFTDTGESDESFDLVLSEDSFLHAGQHREAAIREAARVLKPGGHLVFSDIMQSDTCNLEQMAPVYKRIQLDDMGSPQAYRRWAEKAGLEFVEFEDLTGSLPKHYGAVREVLLSKHRAGDLEGHVKDEFVENMASGLQSWVDQASKDNLAWGYMVFRKPEVE